MAYICMVCDYIFVPKNEKNNKDDGQKAFQKLPRDWKCPECGAKKSSFIWVDHL